MVRDGGDITALVTARLPEVAGVLDLLDDGGGHLAHTVGHRHPAGWADLEQPHCHHNSHSLALRSGSG